MSQIITIIVEQNDGNMAVNWMSSDGLPPTVALAAVTAVRERMYRVAVEAEVRAQIEQNALVDQEEPDA